MGDYERLSRDCGKPKHALGLIAAIPALVFYNMFTSDLDKYGGRLEGYADELSAILSRKLSKGV